MQRKPAHFGFLAGEKAAKVQRQKQQPNWADRLATVRRPASWLASWLAGERPGLRAQLIGLDSSWQAT